MLADTRKSPYAKGWGPENGDVRLDDGFWNDCFQVVSDSTVSQLQKMFDDAKISHVVQNFRICAGEAEGRHHGTPFGDGDFYKWMEAALYAEEGRPGGERGSALEEDLERYIRLIGLAQRPDGYLSTKQIIAERQGDTGSRLKDINEFEVYNFGHLFTTACIHKRLTGKDSLLKIAEKTAGYLEQLYQTAEEKGEVQTAVCPSHYMGLLELYRTTGEERYKKLAQKAMDLRDQVEHGLDDNQDRLPLAEHETIVGHAVRANYLYAGVADLYAETGNPVYLSVLHRVWESLVTKKLYLTGGCGALYNGVSPYGNFFRDQKIHQAYGYEYQLPNITAYNETCASVGGVMWAWRMFLVEPKAEYMDVLERMMYNGNLGSVSLDGKRFFYENMLRRTKKLDYELVWPLERTEYIKSYCCPPNAARLFAQVKEYLYMLGKDEVWTGLYGSSTLRCNLENGASFTLHQQTEYPYDGEIRFTFSDVKRDVPWKLHLRIPAWAGAGHLSLNGTCVRQLGPEDAGSYLEIEVGQTKDAEVVLHLEMPVRLTLANPMVEEDENHGAVERGPLVYCMESADVNAETLDDLFLPEDAVFETEEYEIQGRTMTTLRSNWILIKREIPKNSHGNSMLYYTYKKSKKEIMPVRLIPYFAWDNRGMGEMRIWFPMAYSATTL